MCDYLHMYVHQKQCVFYSNQTYFIISSDAAAMASLSKSMQPLVFLIM